MKLRDLAKSLFPAQSKAVVVKKEEDPKGPLGIFSPDVTLPGSSLQKRHALLARSFQRHFPVPTGKPNETNTGPGFTADGKATGMDASLKVPFQAGSYGVDDLQLGFFADTGFPGFQILALLAQHWLIDKACTMPAKDAVRNGFEVTVNDGTEVSEDVLEAIRKGDKQMKLAENLVEFERFARVFGIRVAMFKMDVADPLTYYRNPFNPDGIKPGMYRGISQIDPYWMAPLLDSRAAADPTALNFYEPTWWNIGGLQVHSSHLVITVPNPVADVLKSSYLYAGTSVPQQISPRVYCAERIANEAPLLAMTKRLTVLHIDIAQALANEEVFIEKMEKWTSLMNNFGVKIVGQEETIEQFDTSLADLDDAIMTQYQLVAAGAGVPATKLLGTQPKGFNTTGEFEESSYHEMLESIQENHLTPLIQRHHLCLIRSEICPKFGIKPFGTEPKWAPLDAPTAKELAETNLIKAQTGAALVSAGAIDGVEERARVIADPESGYNGLTMDTLPEDPEDPDAEGNDPTGEGEEKTGQGA